MGPADERSRLARELDDDLNQRLAFLVMEAGGEVEQELAALDYETSTISVAVFVLLCALADYSISH